MNALTSKLGITAAATGVAVLATLLIGTASARAASIGDTTTEVVRYGDLNVSTDAGARRLYLRLRHAAERVCGDGGDPFEYLHVYRNCEQEAIDSAIAQAALPKLTALNGRHFSERAANRGARMDVARGAPAIVLRG